jgi:hypothetical protein
MAVDEIDSKAHHYQLAFQQTAYEHRRRPQAWFHETAFAALADVLQIAVTVNVVKEAKALRKQHHYGSEASTVFDSVILHKFGSNYRAEVKAFEGLEIPKPTSAMPVLKESLDEGLKKDLDNTRDSDEEKDKTDAALLAEIDKANEDLVKEYEEIVAQLENKFRLADGSFNKGSLQELYIESMRPENLANREIKGASLEHGTEAFFAQFKTTSTSTSVFESYEDKLVRSLIEAIARLACLGQVNLGFELACGAGV